MPVADLWATKQYCSHGNVCMQNCAGRSHWVFKKILPSGICVMMQDQPSGQRKVWNWAVVCIGVICALCGTTAAVKALLSAT